MVPFRWVATSPLNTAFLVLDANLELTVADSQTALTLIGSYRSPDDQKVDAC